MFERNSYLQKRAALHNLGFMRKLAALKSAALGTGPGGVQTGIVNLLRYIQAGKGNNINWGKVLASATPEQRFILRQALGKNVAAAQGGDKAIFNDFSKANKTLDAIFKQDYRYRTSAGGGGYFANNKNDLTGHYHNTGELGPRQYKNTFRPNQNGSLIYWDKNGMPVNPMKNPYSKSNGFYMPMVNGAGNTVLQGMDPVMANRLHSWYRSPEGMEYLKAQGMGRMGVVNNQPTFIPMVPEDIQLQSMNPNIQNFARQQAQLREQLAQQQAMAQTNQQMNSQAGGSAVAGDNKGWSDKAIGYATVGGLGLGIPWAIGTFGRSDTPRGTADYNPERYYV